MNHVPSPAPTTADAIDELAIKRAKADVAPRVSVDDLEANIVSEHYFTAAEGAFGVGCNADWFAGREGPYGEPGRVKGPLDLLTFCVLTLKNGFTVTGESAVASPENFNADIGKSIARANAVAKIWPLMGYELRSKLAAEAANNTFVPYGWADVKGVHTLENFITGTIDGHAVMRDGKEIPFSVQPALSDFETKGRILAQLNAFKATHHV
jgi:hypothetical protein